MRLVFAYDGRTRKGLLEGDVYWPIMDDTFADRTVQTCCKKRAPYRMHRQRLQPVWIICLFVWPGLVHGQAAGKSASQFADLWKNHIFPILENSCADCHSGDQPDGSLDLTLYSDLQQAVAHRREWRRIAERVRNQEMPPPDSLELSGDDRAKLLEFVEKTLPEIPCGHLHHAGPVTIRRLTRYEYKNTIRDLLGIETELPDDFPKDEAGYGFDNIGDVLSVSPLLLEKYLTAAEFIVEQTVFDPARLRIEKTIRGDEFPPVDGSRAIEFGHVLTTRGELIARMEIPADGLYEIEVQAWGDQAGDEPCEMGLIVGSKQVAKADVKATDDEPGIYKFTRKLRAGENRIGLSFNNDFYDPDDPDRRQRDRNLFVGNMRITGPSKLNPKLFPESHRRFMVASPDERTTPRQAAERILAWQGARAFRRKLSEHESSRLLKLFDETISSGATFEASMQVVLQAILVSPHFLFKIEDPVPTDGTPSRLSDFELATAISFFTWSSMPDDELFRLAATGKLSESKTLREQVDRMLNDGRSRALIDNFVEQWLQLPRLAEIDPDPEQFPGFNAELRQSMIQETKLLVGDIFRNDLSLKTLLTADYSFLNRDLAEHYGVSTDRIPAEGFVKIQLDEETRNGLLTHASFLTMTSNPTRTSPVKRGKWVLENLLLDPPPPALPNVPQLESQAELTGSLRERMEQHRIDPNCAGCHRKMDSIGFALENYDAIGKFRTEDAGLEIDSNGTFPDGSQFQGARQLQQTIVDTCYDDFVRCLVEKLFIYAIGRGPLPTDDCVIEGIARRAVKEDYSFKKIIVVIVESEPFQMRASR